MKLSLALSLLTATMVQAFTQQGLVSRSSSSLQMVAGGVLGGRCIGIGSATPSTVVTNLDLEKVVDTSDEWIRTRTGISQRRVLQEGESLRDLSTQAAQQALKMSGKSPEDIDVVVCCCSSPDELFGDATSIAAGLGCGTNTMAFDLAAACSGFLFGVVTASQFLHSGSASTVLVVGADALSRWVDWDDRNVCILFGDAAGAMVIERDMDTPGVLGYATHSNGEGWKELNCFYDGKPRKVETPGDGTTLTKGEYGPLAMNGREVYKFATREVPNVLQEALEGADMTADDVDWLLLHQANIRIMETVASRMGIPMEKVLTNLSDYGNTSAASIPLAFDEAVRKGQVKKGDVIACAGFGAGLSWGSAILRWDGE